MHLGRRAERKAIERLLADVRSRRSGVLVVRGEAGIGKTALLEYARGAASGFRVEHAAGVESEMELAFAGLHQLCAPLLDRLGALPEPQQAALGVAFGLRAGDPPDRFLVGLASLSLLADASEERPLLCLVDDAQWLDAASAQTLAFVARRVGAERVALVLALRDPSPDCSPDHSPDPSDAHPFAGLLEVGLDGLGEADAQALLATGVRTPLDERIRDRIIAEARGNPLALLELPRSAEPMKLAGGFGLPDALSVPRRIEESFQRRSRSLPAETQLLLLAAAAEPLGDTALLRGAAEHLGIDAEAAAPAKTAELLEIGARVRFLHPLVRSAVYRAAEPSDRRRVHRALAAATDPQADPDHRAWHRAQATLGADETIAVELERLAGRAWTRGGPAAAAAFLEQAVVLTPEPADRARRALAAAHATHQAGASEAALELLTVAAAVPLDPLGRTQVELLRAQIVFDTTRGSEVPGMLVDVAKTLVPLDAAMARRTYLQALEAAVVADSFGRGRRVQEVAEAARTAPAPPHPPGVVDLLLDGLVTRATQGYEASMPRLRRALGALGDHDRNPHIAAHDRNPRTAAHDRNPHIAAHDRNPRTAAEDDSRSWLWLGSRVAVSLFDDETARELAGRRVRLAREAGALSELPAALDYLAVVLAHTGELTQAAELVAEATAIQPAIVTVAGIQLAAWRGRQAETAELYADMVPDATRRGESAVVTVAQYTLAVLHNSLGDYRAAFDAAAGPSGSDELEHSNLALPELIEAAVRADEPASAADALELLSSRARVGGTQWALGLEARSRALTSTGPTADALYREAIERFGCCRMVTCLARAHLVYGEWLRREGRRQAAREQLRTAHELLSGMGAEAFAARAARELRATGERPHKPTARPADALTAQELHIVRRVATGATSKEVGTQLFLSPRTVDAHLRSIFRKLDITSRRQLRDMRLP